MTHPPGLFVTGSDTGVGKTCAAALIARALRAAGFRVGVYKPAESGCEVVDGELVAADALALWRAAGEPGALADVCPQRFAAPLAPHLAAREECRAIDAALLRAGLDVWREKSDVVIVEGAGGLFSPVGDKEYVADLAADLGLPLVVVVRNAIGAINQALVTLRAAAAHRGGLPVAAVVLSDVDDVADPSKASNVEQLRRHCPGIPVTHLTYRATGFAPQLDWLRLAGQRKENEPRRHGDTGKRDRE